MLLAAESEQVHISLGLRQFLDSELFSDAYTVQFFPAGNIFYWDYNLILLTVLAIYS